MLARVARAKRKTQVIAPKGGGQVESKLGVPIVSAGGTAPWLAPEKFWKQIGGRRAVYQRLPPGCCSVALIFAAKGNEPVEVLQCCGQNRASMVG